MISGSVLVFACEPFCASIRRHAAVTLDTELGQKYVQVSCAEVVALPASVPARTALPGTPRWVLKQARYLAEIDHSWMLKVINRDYGTDFPLPVPESNTGTMK